MSEATGKGLSTKAHRPMAKDEEYDPYVPAIESPVRSACTFPRASA